LSHTHIFVTQHLSHTIFHQHFVTHQLCHTPSFTPSITHTHKLVSHNIFLTPSFTNALSHTTFVTHHHLSPTLQAPKQATACTGEPQKGPGTMPVGRRRDVIFVDRREKI
jgi:hypothetical protein